MKCRVWTLHKAVSKCFIMLSDTSSTCFGAHKFASLMTYINVIHFSEQSNWCNNIPFKRYPDPFFWQGWKLFGLRRLGGCTILCNLTQIFFAGSFPDFGIRSRNKVTLQKHTKVSTLNVDLWKCGYWLELHSSLSGHFYYQTILLFCQVTSSIFCFDSSGTSMANLPQTVNTNSYVGPWLLKFSYPHIIM